MASGYDWLFADHATTGSAQALLRTARELAAADDLRTAATAYDRAYTLDPVDAEVARERRALLERLAVVEHGIRFRYIPAGTSLVGSATGEPDERPVHPVRLGDYWLAETAVSWATYCDLAGWTPPPTGLPTERVDRRPGDRVDAEWFVREANKIRLQYCEDATTKATDWHAHAPRHDWVNMGTGTAVDSWSLFGRPARDDPRRPWRYDRKPMVAVAWQDAQDMCARLTTSDVWYGLPTEAEWERAARGGLAGRTYPWGDEPPTPDRCDFDRFDEFAILPMRRLPPNGYGLYGMAGSVWEWTADWYDAQYYAASPASDPTGPPDGEEKVLRGGSWADCGSVVTASFRMSRGSKAWRDAGWGPHLAPNIGFRICRRRPAAAPAPG
jgi:formylglycine-generating enzyme